MAAFISIFLFFNARFSFPKKLNFESQSKIKPGVLSNSNCDNIQREGNDLQNKNRLRAMKVDAFEMSKMSCEQLMMRKGDLES